MSENLQKYERILSENEQSVVEIVQAMQPINHTELKAKLEEKMGKPVSQPYVSTLVGKLVNDGVLSSTGDEKGSKLLALAQDVSVETGKALIPTPTATTPEMRLRQILTLFGLRGEQQSKLMGLITINPGFLSDSNQLFSLLISSKIDPSTARQIAQAYFQSIQYENMQVGMGMGPMGIGMPIGQQSNWIQQPMIQPYGQQGATVAFGPSGQPIIVQPPQQPQPASVPIPQQTAMRRVQRPMRGADGAFVKDATGNNYIYETVEEPVQVGLQSNSNSDYMQMMITQQQTQQQERDRQEQLSRDAESKRQDDLRLAEQKRQDDKDKFDREEREKERQHQLQIAKIEADAKAEVEKAKAESERLRQEALEKRLADIQKESKESTEGLFSMVQQVQEKSNKALTETVDKIMKDNAHQREVDGLKTQLATQSTAGTRPVVAIANDINRTLRELPTNVATAMRSMPYIPQGVAGQIPTMTPDQQAAEAARLAAQR